MSKIITVTGKMYSGKTTTVEGIAEVLGDNSIVVSFGDILRSYAQEGLDAVLDGYSIESVAETMEVTEDHAREFIELVGNEDSVETRTEGIRRALQEYGTVWVTGEVWADRLVSLCKTLSTRYETILISGCRLKAEHDAFKSVAYQVRLDISPELQKDRALARDGFVDEVGMSHVNETEIDNETFDLRFTVDGLTPAFIVDKVMASANLK